MSMMNKFSPQKTRDKKREPRGSNATLAEARVGPVQEIKQEILDNPKAKITKLVEEYQYQPEDNKPEIAPEEQPTENAPQEQTGTINKIKVPVFSMFDMMPMCEEYLLLAMYGPHEPTLKKIQELNRLHLYNRLEVISEYKQPIEMDAFKDNLFFYKGEVVILEEQLHMTGFLKEYFQIAKVHVLYNNGEFKLKETGFCNFWFRDRLEKFFNSSFRELSHSEVLDPSACNRCLFNPRCPFSRVQQMTK